MAKPTLVLHSKDSVKTSREKRRNWYRSREGRAALQETVKHQNNLSRSIHQKMSEAKLKTGTTGLTNAEYDNFFGDMLGQQSHQGSSISTNTTRKTYKVVKGRIVRVR